MILDQNVEQGESEWNAVTCLPLIDVSRSRMDKDLNFKETNFIDVFSLVTSIDQTDCRNKVYLLKT